jgi:hypothetical protein
MHSCRFVKLVSLTEGNEENGDCSVRESHELRESNQANYKPSFCHSEQSEESLVIFGPISTEINRRCFASLDMTAPFRDES